jgi:hypothetical protein
MKSRTDGRASWFIAWGIAGSIIYACAPARSGAGHTFLFVSDFVAVVLWTLVLKRKWWARNALIGVLAVQSLEMIRYAKGMPAAHGPLAGAFWTFYIPISCMVAVWQLVVLLAEKPQEWAEES